MKAEQVIELVKSPAAAGEEHISSIEKIIADFPYFQTAHLLYTKTLHNCSNLNYHQSLKRSAVVAGDRGLLYRLLQQKPQVKIIEEAKKTVQEEKQPSNLSITYNVVPVLKPEINTQKLEISQPEITKEEVFTRKPVKQETLERVNMKPVIEGYLENEILKITEKESPVEASERSFTDWLQALGQQTPIIQAKVKQEEKVVEKPQTVFKLKTKEEKQQQLDRLLSEELKISKPDLNKDFYAATEKTRGSVIENEELVTETLAKIYVMQKNRSKAIRAYEILSLKFPEKSAYFAALITEIKNTIK